MTRIKRNAFRCKKCGMIVESKSVHDFEQCKCGNFTDGGHDYIRQGGNFDDMEDLSEYEEEEKERRIKMMDEAIASAELTEPFEAPKDKDLTALNQLVEDYTNKETELVKVEQELATRDEQFASFITTQKRLKEMKETLTGMIKEEMEKRGLTEHETDTVILKLTPLGKYKAQDIKAIPDELCKVVKSLDNAKVKAYLQLNGKLPDGVESLGSRLTIKVKTDE